MTIDSMSPATVPDAGRITLTGEIRKIVNMDLRIKECQRIGIKKIFCPRDVDKIDGIEVVSLRNLKELYKKMGKDD